MRKHFWLHLLLVLVGIVTGSMVMEITAGVAWLDWLSFGLDFGTAAPFVLDLHVLTLTFGAAVNITVAHVIFVVLAILLGRLILQD
ncbi:MAG: DUF4321 domain-containing protein [Ruminococcaceae bacterium]|nr:DUF4321 domain-containing protein [Oscillospiraceae bacterium]